jgi:hypothetical protein
MCAVNEWLAGDVAKSSDIEDVDLIATGNIARLRVSGLHKVKSGGIDSSSTVGAASKTRRVRQGPTVGSVDFV